MNSASPTDQQDPVHVGEIVVRQSGASTFDAGVALDLPVDGAMLSLATFVIEGRTAAGAAVSITIDGASPRLVIASSDGRFSHAVTSEAALAAGTHVIRATVTDAAGAETFDEHHITIRGHSSLSLQVGCGCTGASGFARPTLALVLLGAWLCGSRARGRRTKLPLDRTAS